MGSDSGSGLRNADVGTETAGADLVKTDLLDGVAIITISRPEKRNAFNPPLRENLARAIEHAVADDACRGIVLTGAGPHFSVGGDADAFASMSGDDLRVLLAAAHRCITAVRHTPKPVVAAVEGIAAGGAVGLILACDAVVAARDARIAFPFLKLGLVPDWGCVHFLRRKVGEGAARRLLLQASVLSGEAALAAGVADDMVEPGQALAAALERVRGYLSFPGDAWGATKAMLDAPDTDLPAALDLERRHQDACFHAPAFRQALQAFQAGRGSR